MFDQEDLILKTREQIEEEEKTFLVDEKEAKKEIEAFVEFEEDPNFKIIEEDSDEGYGSENADEEIKEEEERARVLALQF